MSQTLHGLVAEADLVADRLGQRPARRPASASTSATSTMATSVMSSIIGPQLPERAALADLVDPVHRAAEGADVARGRPQRAPRGRRPAPSPARLRAGELEQRRLDGAEGILGDERAQHVEDRLHRLLAAGRRGRGWRCSASTAGKMASTRVVGQGRGQVGALVVAELAPAPCVATYLHVRFSGRSGSSGLRGSSGSGVVGSVRSMPWRALAGSSAAPPPDAGAPDAAIARADATRRACRRR